MYTRIHTPFKNEIKNIQELLLLFILMVIHVAPLYKHDSLGLTISQVLLTIGVVYLIVALTVHCIMFRCKTIIYCYIGSIYQIH